MLHSLSNWPLAVRVSSLGGGGGGRTYWQYLQPETRIKQVFDDQKFKQKLQLKKMICFVQKLQFSYPKASFKDIQAT